MPQQTITPEQLYHYQQRDIDAVFERLETYGANYRLLYQLPTGGGKTVVFSEIARRFIERYGRKAIVLTHRDELCRQTSSTLKKLGVKNKVINRNITHVSRNEAHKCYVAMVETLKNRIREQKIATNDVGLVIIDEAHHNSFRKLLGKFSNAFIIGVTATPFSSDPNLPLHQSYDELVTGEPIGNLINSGFLAKPKIYTYEVELNSLKTGIHGDYSVSTSDALYASPAMLGLLLKAYEEGAKNKKTLIFNNGIFTSKKVRDYFEEAGYLIRHLDNKTPDAERREILQWFKKTKGAVLTSVSLLTTGFDEPTVQAVILNRATTSLTLYYQMVGRGARKLANKKTFTIIDLGNNTDRFGEWHATIDWKFVFENPQAYYESLNYSSGSESGVSHAISTELRAAFPESLELAFDIEQAYKDAIEKGEKPKTVIRESVRQHAAICIENSASISDALQRMEALDKEINWRVKQYAKCLGNATTNYRKWLVDDYKARLESLVTKIFDKVKSKQDV